MTYILMCCVSFLQFVQNIKVAFTCKKISTALNSYVSLNNFAFFYQDSISLILESLHYWQWGHYQRHLCKTDHIIAILVMATEWPNPLEINGASKLLFLISLHSKWCEWSIFTSTIFGVKTKQGHLVGSSTCPRHQQSFGVVAVVVFWIFCFSWASLGYLHLHLPSPQSSPPPSPPPLPRTPHMMSCWCCVDSLTTSPSRVSMVLMRTVFLEWTSDERWSMGLVSLNPMEEYPPDACCPMLDRLLLLLDTLVVILLSSPSSSFL